MFPQQQAQDSVPQATYHINLAMAHMLGIDRAFGSLCIKEDNGHTDLGGVKWGAQHEWEAAKRRNDATPAELDQYRKELFGSFDPFAPVHVTLDYPLARAVIFEIKPYRGDGEGFQVYRRFPIGYVAWSIAKKYEEIYRESDNYGVWGHDIADLALESITLLENNVLKVTITS